MFGHTDAGGSADLPSQARRGTNARHLDSSLLPSAATANHTPAVLSDGSAASAGKSRHVSTPRLAHPER